MPLVSVHIAGFLRISSLFRNIFWTDTCTTPSPEPAMDPLTISAASGLRSRMETLDLLANNLANAETSGYKTDHEFYGLYTSADAYDPLGSGFVSTLPVVEKQWTDFSQGTLNATGNPLDVALSGRGFIAVNGPTGPL